MSDDKATLTYILDVLFEAATQHGSLKIKDLVIPKTIGNARQVTFNTEVIDKIKKHQYDISLLDLSDKANLRKYKRYFRNLDKTRQS